MPLILISGFPKAGKSHRSRQVATDFEARIASSTSPRIRRLRVHHVDEHASLGLSRRAYATARAEKDARAAFASAIRRFLAKDTIVIADAPNYIKGFRYQLYCDAKAVPTPSCVLHVATQEPRCRENNEAALAHPADETLAQDGGEGSVTTQQHSEPSGEGSQGAYEPDVFTNLIFRYEEPNGMTRWDAPLFVVTWEDATPDLDAMWEALVGSDDQGAGAGSKTKAPLRPNAATVLKPASEQNYLYELDKTTSEVVAAITAWAADHPGEGGGCVRVGGPAAGVEDTEVRLPVASAAPGVPQLQRLRRQFIQLNRQHSLEKSRLRTLFVDYLNDAFEK